MFRLLILLPLLSLVAGCASTTSQSSHEAAVRNAWFEALDHDNIALHDTLLLALFESRRTGQVVFVRRLELEGADEPLFAGSNGALQLAMDMPSEYWQQLS